MCPETDGRQDTGGTGQYGSGVRRFGHSTREMVMETVLWVGVPEAEVRMVEGMYEKTTAKVMVCEGGSEAFEVNIGLRQGSVLSPLLFISVLDLKAGTQ